MATYCSGTGKPHWDLELGPHNFGPIWLRTGSVSASKRQHRSDGNQSDMTQSDVTQSDVTQSDVTQSEETQFDLTLSLEAHSQPVTPAHTSVE